MTSSGETDLSVILKTLKPVLNEGDFVFCTVNDAITINPDEVISFFREKEGHTIIVRKEWADERSLSYSFIASWITLTVHSSLSAVGLTTVFSKALSEKGISCNVVAACHHDHIFVDRKDAAEAMRILEGLSGN